MAVSHQEVKMWNLHTLSGNPNEQSAAEMAEEPAGSDQ